MKDKRDLYSFCIKKYQPALGASFMLPVLLLLSFLATKVKAQENGKKVDVQIIHANIGTITQIKGEEINKLIGDVHLVQEETHMYCDSAYFNIQKNNFEAFGNVRIVQPATTIYSDYVRYTGNSKMAFLKGDVQLYNEGNTLLTDELEYNVGTKEGTYANGGTLRNDTTTVVSDRGKYNAHTKDARFTGNVQVTDPQSTITSDDLGYNSQTKIMRFFGPSVVNNQGAILKTRSGTFDSRTSKASFTERSSYEENGQYIEADILNYNKTETWAKAKGKVILFDSAQQTTIYCGVAHFNQKENIMLAFEKPVMKKPTDNDTMYIRADTFYAAPVYTLYAPKKTKDTLSDKKQNTDNSKPSKRRSNKQVKVSADTTQQTGTQVKKDKSERITDSISLLTVKDTPGISDTTRKLSIESSIAQSPDSAMAPRPVDTTLRYFKAYNNVRIFSDSMQGLCDSLFYSQEDSTMRMIRKPILWSRSSQITGDTILLYMDSSTIRKMYVPNNAYVISQTGPEAAAMYDQVQGKTMTGYFIDNKMDWIDVFPQAETIYYSKDDNNAYIGINEGKGERLKIFFKDGEMDKIKFEQDVKQKMQPLELHTIPNMRLSRFQWHQVIRPKSKNELFE